MNEQIIINKLKKNKWEVYFEHIDKVSDEEYARIRTETFGASDSSRLLNVNPFANGTLEDLIKEKVTGVYDESIGLKPSVRMGKDIEHIILQKVQELFEREVYKPYNMYKDKNSGLSVNFDGVMEEEDELVPIEAKAVTKYGRIHYDFLKTTYQQLNGEWQPKMQVNLKPLLDQTKFDNIQEYIKALAKEYGIPVYYLTQVQQQMIALGSSKGYLVVMDVDTWNVNVFTVYRDNTIIKELSSLGSAYYIKLQMMKKKSLEKNL